ncbi:MAG: two-component regulator propeller domain-containing protein [Bacteroidota bacterium]
MAHATAQENLRFRKLNRKDGLPSNKIYASVQDNQGCIWIATAGGLSRYDNYEIKTYHANDQHGLESNQIKCLYSDSKGYLWIGTDGGGLTRYDYRTAQFTSFLHEANNPKSLIQNQILSLLEDSRGDLWIGTEAGISKFDYETASFISHVHDPNDASSISSGGVLSILEDKAGRIWMGTWNGGLNLLLPQEDQEDQSMRFLHIRQDENDPYSLSHDAVWSMQEDEVGRLWIGTFGGGLNLMIPPKDGDYYTDPKAFRFVTCSAKSESRNNEKIYAIAKRNQVLWLGTTNGLDLFDTKQLDYTLPLAQLQDQFDRIRFTKYVREYNPRYGLNGNQVVHLYKDRQDMMWISTEKGLAMNPKDRQRIPLYLDDFAQKRGIIVMDFLKDHEGTLWVAHSGKGLSKYNEAKDELEVVYKYKKDGSLLPPFKKIFQAKDKTIWLGTFLGLFHLNPETNEIKRFVSPEINYSFSVEDFAEDQDGNLWIATDANGLIVIDAARKVATYKHRENDSSSVSSNNVTSIAVAPNGQVWISTDGGGFCKAIEQADGSYHFQSFFGQNHAADPPANLINDIAAVGHDLWIGAHNKLFKYNPAKDTCYYYQYCVKQKVS